MTAVYVRQSVDKKDSISIESQIEFCRKMLALDEEYQVYADRGYSGKNTVRPQFQKMLEAIKSGGIEKVIVYKVDRISRAISDFSGMMEFFGANGVEFVSATQPIDTTNPMGKAMLGVVMIFAQLERETIQQRVRDNYYERGSKGFYLGGRPPFGFDKIPARLEGKRTCILAPNEQSLAAAQMFERYALESCSLGELSAALGEAGALTAQGKSWSTSTLSRTLRNPVYVRADAEVYTYLKGRGVHINTPPEEFTGVYGCYLYGQRTNPRSLFGCFATLGAHEGIVSAEVWLECQKKLDTNRPLKNSGRGTHSWLSGRLFCGMCGYAVSIVVNRRGQRYINCGGRKLKTCPGRTEPVYPEVLEKCAQEAVLGALRALSGVRIYPSSGTDAQINPLKIERLVLMQKAERLAEKIQLCEAVSAEYLNRTLSGVCLRQREIEAEIEGILKKEREGAMALPEGIAERWQDFPFEVKKQIAAVLIERIEVFSGGMTVDFF